VLFFGTIMVAVFVSFAFGDKFISTDNMESVSNISLPSDVYVMYPELIKKLDALPGSLDLTELRKLEAEYGIDLNINFENKRFFGVMVNYRNAKEYSIGIIFGIFAALLFLFKYLGSRNIPETQEEKSGSNFLIYLNLYVISPIIIFTLHFLDLQQGWTSSGVFIPMGLVTGAFLALVLFIITIISFIRTAKKSLSGRAILWKIIEPIIWIIALLVIYTVYFEWIQYL